MRRVHVRANRIEGVRDWTASLVELRLRRPLETYDEKSKSFRLSIRSFRVCRRLLDLCCCVWGWWEFWERAAERFTHWSSEPRNVCCVVIVTVIHVLVLRELVILFGFSRSLSLYAARVLGDYKIHLRKVRSFLAAESFDSSQTASARSGLVLWWTAHRRK